MLAISAVPTMGSGVIGLFGEVGWFGKVIVFILMGFSVVSWAMILLKYQFLRRSEKESHAFLIEFRKTKDIEVLFKQAEAKKYSPLATLFAEGYRKAESIIKTLPEGKVTAEERPLLSQEIERSLKINTQDELVYMERYLAFLGTTGTVGPLLGLLATVWGIMEAFYGIGLKGAGDISALAPGLAAALINTSMGLFVAIPAVIAYNYFSEKINGIATRMDSFSMEFLSFIERNLSGEVMSFERRQRHLIREINLVPLIDVLLVVLFFYMIISPMMSRGLDVNLPKSVANTVKQEDRIVLTATHKKELFVEQERVDIAKLQAVLDSIRKSKPLINVYLRADKSTPYGFVVQVMDVVKRAGIDRLGMVTEAAPGGEPAR